MPRVARGLPPELQLEYKKQLTLTRAHFGQISMTEVGALIAPFINVPWARYRRPAALGMSEFKVRRIARILMRLREINPDPWWWRKTRASGAAVALHYQGRHANTRRLSWGVAFLDFLQRILPKDADVDIFLVTRTRTIRAIITHAAGVWELQVNPAARVGFRLYFATLGPGPAEPLLAGSWSREFWLRFVDLLSPMYGLQPLALENA